MSLIKKFIVLIICFAIGRPVQANDANPNSLKNKIFNLIHKAQALYKQKPKKTAKYDLTGLSGTIDYKLYLIIEELKKQSQVNDLFLNRLILYGPPGNGKSTYVRKIAELTNSTLFELSGPTIVNTYQGSGSASIKQVFEKAFAEMEATKRKVFIFIDEIDAIDKKSNNETNQKTVDHEAAIQTLWIYLDKIKNNPNIFVFLATNKFKHLNPILLDRFGDNVIEISNPDEKMRQEIIEFYNTRFGVNLETKHINYMIKKTEGFSVRAIEDLARSIKRSANTENNGVVNCEIIDNMLEVYKQKPQFTEEDADKRLDKIIKYINLIGSIAAFPGYILNGLHLRDYLAIRKA